MRRWARGDRPRARGPVYLSIDLDGIDPGFAPGVSHPEPGGLTVREVLDVVQALDGPIVGADIVELNPRRDPAGLTAVVAAKLVKEVAARMTGAEYTHVAEDCTFQTLIKRFSLRDPALAALGEIVHDIDCKDELFKRPETTGIQSLIRGIVRTTADDLARIERGASMLDDLYQSFGRR